MSNLFLGLRLAVKKTDAVIHFDKRIFLFLLFFYTVSLLGAQDIDMFEIVNEDPLKFGDDISLFQEQLESPQEEDGIVYYNYLKPKRMLFMGDRAENASIGFCENKLCGIKMNYGSTYEDFEKLRNRITKLYGGPQKSKKSFSMKETATWRYQGVILIMVYNPSRLYTEVTLFRQTGLK